MREHFFIVEAICVETLWRVLAFFRIFVWLSLAKYGWVTEVIWSRIKKKVIDSLKKCWKATGKQVIDFATLLRVSQQYLVKVYKYFSVWNFIENPRDVRSEIEATIVLSILQWTSTRKLYWKVVKNFPRIENV